MYGIGDQVGETIELQGALMGYNRSRVSQRQPCRRHVLVRGRRKVSEPVQPTSSADVSTPVSRVVTQRAAIHPGFYRLAGSEIPCLGLRQPIKTLVVYVMHKGDVIP